MKEVWQKEGPVVVLAAPGTGKTFTLARRIKYLVDEEKVTPQKIYCITFTKDAKEEMIKELSNKEKITYVKEGKRPRFIRTTHSLGMEIIKNNRVSLGLKPKNYKINLIDGEIIDIVLADLYQLNYNERGGIKENGSKNKTIIRICREKGKCSFDPKDKKCIICKKYEKLLRKLNTLDYCDQIKLACRVLKNSKKQEQVKKEVKHLLVDEYQDINGDQFTLINLLSKDNREGLFVVGDDDQSIYSFRGGSTEYILNFCSHFKNANEEELNTSRRLTRFNHEGALCVLKNITVRRNKKTLSYIDGDGDKIHVIESYSQQNEAKNIVKIIQKRKKIDNINDFLILMPKIDFAKDIISELKRGKIEFICKQKVEKFGINEIEKIISWIKKPTDSFLLREIIEKIIQEVYQRNNDIYKKISQLWKDVNFNKSLFNVLKENSATDDDLYSIYSLLNGLIEAYNNNDRKYYDFIFCKFGIYKNVKEFDQEMREILGDINYFYTYKAKDKVRIMTMNGAKGLQAEDVFIIGLEKGVFPRPAFDLDEEKRLFYVSLTRAKKRIYLCTANIRKGDISFAPYKKNGLEKSPFVGLINDNYKVIVHNT